MSKQRGGATDRVVACGQNAVGSGNVPSEVSRYTLDQLALLDLLAMRKSDWPALNVADRRIVQSQFVLGGSEDTESATMMRSRL